MKLAQALLLRKQLEQKVEQLRPIKELGEKGLFEQKIKRVSVSDTTDELTMTMPRLTLGEATQEFDKYATALRKLDAAIQRTNWEQDLKGFNDNESPFQI